MDSVETIDVLVVFALLWVGWRALATRPLFNAVVLFIVFGLLMALAWVRLGASDIALAEAAIGAGLSGVLLLDAVAQVQAQRQRRRDALRALPRATVFVLALALSGAVALGAAAVPLAPHDLPGRVMEQLHASGVSHPVTAVLLNFRGYDTMLEVGVLLLAVFGILALRPSAMPQVAAQPVSDVLAALTRLLVPLVVLVAGYLLWAGSHRPGGAFQAGAVLAAAGVLLRLIGRAPALAAPSAPWRFGIAVGLGAFLGVAAAAATDTRLLQYPPNRAGTLMLLIETALTVSIALILYTLFAAAPSSTDRRRR